MKNFCMVTGGDEDTEIELHEQALLQRRGDRVNNDSFQQREARLGQMSAQA